MKDTDEFFDLFYDRINRIFLLGSLRPIDDDVGEQLHERGRAMTRRWEQVSRRRRDVLLSLRFLIGTNAPSDRHAISRAEVSVQLLRTFVHN